MLAQAQLVPDVLVVDIGIAQKLLDKPDQISRLLIGKAKGRIEPLESIAGNELHRVAPDAESDLERLTDSFHLNLTAFGLLSFMVGLFIVNSAIGLAFEQRLPMLRTLRACGVSAKLLNTMLVIELVSLAVVGGLIGMVCGYLIAAALLPDVAASLRGLYGAPIPGELSLRARMVDRGPCGQHRRRAGGRNDQPRSRRSACRCWRWRSRRPGARRSGAG